MALKKLKEFSKSMVIYDYNIPLQLNIFRLIIRLIKFLAGGEHFQNFKHFSRNEGLNPLYEYLTSEKTNRKFAGEITWNFNIFLVNLVGELIARFESKVKPEDEKIATAIRKALR